ncbi:MAG TPA: hypothetical protein GX405_08110 [Rhizobiales bacterium]|nr:hypothetical protein [Hyphomicrobiales bacterium]
MTSVNLGGAPEVSDGLSIGAPAAAGFGSAVAGEAGGETAVDPDAEESSLWSEYEAHVAARRYDEAKAALDELYRRNWRRHQVCLALARVAGATRQHEQAVGYFEEAAKYEPLNAAHSVSLAKHLNVTGELGRALALLEEAKSGLTGKALVRCLLAAYAIHCETRDWAAAEKCLAEILAVEPDNQAALVGLVEVAGRRHDYAAIIDRATRALAVMPGDARLEAIRDNARLQEPSGFAVAGELPRVMILSAVVPGEDGSGGRYFQSVIDLYPRDRLAFFCVTRMGRFKLPADMPGLPIGLAFDPVPRTMYAAPEGSDRYLSWKAAWDWALDHESKVIAAEALNFARRHGSEVIVVAANPLTFRIAREIRALSPIRISMMVLDPLEIRFKTYQVPAALHRVIEEDLAAAMRIAHRCATSSDNMAEEYLERYGQEPLVLPHGLSREVQRTGRHRRLGDGRLTIALLGALYATDAISAFVAALAAADWTIGGRRVSLICMTRELPPGSDPSMPIEHIGWIGQDELVSTLDRADLAYVAYWFDGQYSDTVRLSFPSKITPMAAAGLPIFFHGPSHSSVVRFLRKHPMGVACTSLEASDILERLTDLVSSPGRYAAAAVAAETAFAMELSHDVFRERFLKLVGAAAVPSAAGTPGPRVLSGSPDSG